MKTLKVTTLLMILAPAGIMAQNPFGVSETDTSTTRDIYGYDSRREAKTYDYNGYTQAVLTQIHKDDFNGNDAYAYTLEQQLKNRYKANVDPSVRFKDQPALGNCTGFLIAPDIMVTAAHCISSDNHMITDGVVQSHTPSQDKYAQFDYADWKWVFDYTNDLKMTKKSDAKIGDYFITTIPSSNQYTVKKVLKSVMDWDNLIDYAVIQLDRETDRDPFRFRTGAKIAKGDNLAMIGSPAGLPLKLADGAQVTLNTSNNWFGTNLDAFGGNSGGPVYNTAGIGMLEGILVRGRIDKGQKGYYLDSTCNCVKEVRYENEEAESILDDWGIEMDLMSTEVQRITGIPLNIKVRAIYGNMEHAIRKNDADQFDKYLIYTWIFQQDTAAFVKNELAGKDPVGVIALNYGRTEMFKTLIDEGMDCSLKLEGGRTMLYHAINKNNLEAVNYILQQGYNLEQKDDNGNTPLFWAINNYNTSAVEALLKNGASVSTTDASGDQPLHAAVKSGDLDMVKLLVASNASLTATDSDGNNALKIAKKRKYKAIKKYLKQAKKGKI